MYVCMKIYIFCNFFFVMHIHHVMCLTWVDKVGLRVQQDPQRLHVIVEILEDSRAFAQDAVSGKECPLFFQQQRHVVVSMARCEQHSGNRKGFVLLLYQYLLYLSGVRMLVGETTLVWRPLSGPCLHLSGNYSSCFQPTLSPHLSEEVCWLGFQNLWE